MTRVLFFCGAAHSGSTLLGLLLGAHPLAFYGGELCKTRKFSDPDAPTRKKNCAICGTGCAFWSGFQPDFAAGVHRQIAGLTGCAALVDSSLRLDWLKSQLPKAAASGLFPALILLVRDGRAVLNSRLRKRPQANPADLARNWLAQMRGSEELFAGFRGPKLRLAYEDLARAPQTQVKLACALLELEFAPGMLDFARRDWHLLGANAGVKQSLALAKGLAGQGESCPLIRPDERWRNELSDEAREVFERLAGRLNAAYCSGSSLGAAA